MPAADWIDLQCGTLPVDEARQWVSDDGCGAVVVFCGTVRDHSHSRVGVTSLEYEAYDAPAKKAFASVAATTRARFPGVARLALLHRTGLLTVSEVAVVVAVSAPHRDEAFAAASFAIDALKRDAPIWKRENWADGSQWVEGCALETSS